LVELQWLQQVCIMPCSAQSVAHTKMRICWVVLLAGKGPRDMLFDTFDATDLNKELKGLMDGLSVKVRA
jgi:hypothetical protein